MPRLSYTDPSGEARVFVLRDRTRIGRLPGQDIQILDRVVSKEHAVVEREGERWFVRDAGSRNGTRVNGVPVEGSAELRQDDEICVGTYTLRYDATEERPRVTVPKFTIREDSFENAIRSRLRQTGGQHFLPADELSDVEQLRRDYEKLRIANELNQALSNEFDLATMLNRTLEKAFEMFQADRGVILLLDEQTGEPVPAAVRARDQKEELVTGDLRISRTILREVMEEKSAVLSSDAMVDSRFGGVHSIMLAGIRATMSVPLLYQDTILGVIHLDSQMASGVFTDKDLSLLTGFAQQAARAIMHFRLVDRQRKETVAREQLGRLLPPEVVDEVMKGNLLIQRSGDLRNTSVMFADIRGFTSMSERSTPQAVVDLLNEYFEVMVDVVFRFGGTLDKFVGDEIMAVWGAPIPQGDHALRAVAAALEMQAEVARFNAVRSARGQEAIQIGVGINSGEVVAGYMGSSRSMHYTVIGDVVNVASRLCGVAERGDVIVSTATRELVRDEFEFESLPPRALKGKSEHVALYRVLRTRR